MALYPKAKLELLTVNKGRRTMAVYNRLGLHVAVSLARTLFGWFMGRRNPDSHFYVLKDGTVIQYVDTKYRANADLEGNDATISVETQGGVLRPNSEAWTPQQVVALADLFAWVRKVHGIKNQVASNSKIGVKSHGLSWHRLGVNGNFPKLPSILAGRNQRGGGMFYSKSRGKICPGDVKIKQVAEIFRLSQSAGVVVTPTVDTSSGNNLTPVTGEISVDYWWGPATTGLTQKLLGQKVDKVVSQQFFMNKEKFLGGGWEWTKNTRPAGSQMIYALQVILSKKGLYKGALDGLAGPMFWSAFKRNYKVYSLKAAIGKHQANLNKGKVL